MAASLGLGHEAYNAYPSDLMAANNNCAAMSFVLPPAGAMANGDYCFPELGVVHPPPPDYYSPPQVLAETDMNMRFVDDGGMSMSLADGNGGHNRRATPSRIGFRTRSEVDVLDDGFKWRKYGKKAVKSSPNPRNYYRCSVEGCGVKKRVERDHHDHRYVITTYDGVHNHAAAGAARGYPPPSDVWGIPHTGGSSESSY